jgi:hexokinase
MVKLVLTNERLVLPVSIFDNKLDRESINPRKQAFEKMVSGMCRLLPALPDKGLSWCVDIGEITRNILLHFIDSSLLFGGYSSEILNTHYGYDAAFVSGIEGAKTPEDAKKIIVSELKVDAERVTPDCIEIVQWACRAVATRAAHLAACAVAAVIVYTKNHEAVEGEEDKGVDVGMDGSWVSLSHPYDYTYWWTGWPSSYLASRVAWGKHSRLSLVNRAKRESGSVSQRTVVVSVVSQSLDLFARVLTTAAALTALQAKKALDKRVKNETHKGSKEVPGETGPQRSHE